MKDSKQVRSEYQSFVESYSKISKERAEEAKEAKSKKHTEKGEKEEECSCKEMVQVRKSGAFTELAEKYQMSVKQFARFVENNQGLFDVGTRKKAVLANKFQGFKETVEWDEFFGDLEMVEQVSFTVGGGDPNRARRQQKINKAADAGVPNAASKSSGPLLPKLKLANSNELEGEDLQEITTKETKSGTKYKVRVKDKATGSSYIRFATREKIAQLRADPKISSVEMTDEGEAPEERGEKKAVAKGGGKKKLDPVGREDKDVDNDGDHDKSDKYLLKRRSAISKAIKKRNVRTEGFSDWRADLVEVMDKVEKKPKGGKVDNKVTINPTMGENFDPQKIAESLGAQLISCEEIMDGEVIEQVTTQTQFKPLPSSGSTGYNKPPAAPTLPAPSSAKSPKKPPAKQPHKPNPMGYAIRGNIFSAEDAEVSGGQLDENPMIGLGIKAGLAAGTALAGKMAYDKAKSTADALKKRNQKIQDARKQLRQSNELEGQVISERGDEPGEGPRQKYGDMRGLDRSGPGTSFGGKWQSTERKKAGAAALGKMVKQADSYDMEGEVLDEKALSKKQQKFMGMVYAAKKGGKPASPEVAKAAAEMTKKAARDFAKTKHKGLPEKKKEKK